MGEDPRGGEGRFMRGGGWGGREASGGWNRFLVWPSLNPVLALEARSHRGQRHKPSLCRHRTVGDPHPSGGHEVTVTAIRKLSDLDIIRFPFYYSRLFYLTLLF